SMAFVRVVREDPARRGLLYAGTELGVFVSFDEGGSWQPLRMQVARRAPAKIDEEPATGLMPIVPITDLVVKGRDLVASMQGRGFWILDDLSPLRQDSSRGQDAGMRLYALEPGYRFGGPSGRPGETGLNPPAGAFIYYRLPKAPGDKDEVTLEILDGA